MFEQCAVLEVIEPFSFKPSKGRTVEGKLGQKFWVTSPTYNNKNYCLISRKGQGSANAGWQLNNSDIVKFFKLI
jgi:hypothetical protein